ncbi:hypothetical protein INS49_013306 [Diaporthe citri]|uniref:uncharacterized protein n=1 Tax=Diaporthe citri TaxID=83186 RepID=UPI001C806610|nr:uncharacterized protein INS49_013306 [Diaporthe citri]KAG6357429.1 hypothetical protein INS49_013306 [Diaporthe citri]
MASGSDFIPPPRDRTVGFIDCGDLGQAILKGIIRKSILNPQDSNSWAKATYIASVPSEKSAQELRQAIAADPGTNGSISLEVLHNQNSQVANRSEIVILASPEGTAEAILKGPGMTDALKGKYLISLVAGATIAQMTTAL